MFSRFALAFLFALYVCPISFAQNQIDVSPNGKIPLRMNDNTTIRFSDGTWFVTDPISVANADKSVVLEAQPGCHPIISGGQLIVGWKSSTLNGHDCWVAYLPAVRMGLLNFRELWVDGVRATRSRFPAHGYLESVEPEEDKTPWNQGQTWFGYKPGDLPDDLPKEAEAIVLNRWEESRLPIDSVNPANHRVNSTRKTVFQLQDGDLYFLEGASQWMVNPGDWYLDRNTGNLYYLPRAGEAIDKITAIIPTTDRLLDVKNAAHVTLRGLTFCNTEWNLPDPVPGEPPAVGGFGQAAIGVSPAITFAHCHDCRIESCRFEHLGNYALELGKGCQNNVIDHCTFTDMGAGAIKIGQTEVDDALADPNFGNAVTNCRINDGGHMFPSATGIWAGQSYNNRISHNEIADFYSNAISMGWTWGYTQSLSRQNRIEKNLIHHLGRRSDGDGPILSDMGGVYLLGVRAGTVVSGNVIHDVAGKVYGGWGIYLDEGSSDVTIDNNLVYRTTHGGFHLHYGKNNTVQNNIFALSRDLQIARTTTEDQLMLTFKHNLVYWNTGKFTATDARSLSFDENLYYCFGEGKLMFGDQTFDQWQSSGQDKHTIIVDPDFTNAAHDQFTLKADSPARRIHFVPFDTSDAGPLR